jgi:MFS family permease
MTKNKNPAVGKYPIAAAALGLMLTGSFIPTPLYELYRREWGLTPAEISIVFAVYAGSLIPALLFLGGISDTVGRRKTLFVALAIGALASLVFALASGFWWLLVARALQGIALGIGAGTAVAAIREWMDESMRPRAGVVALIGISTGSALGALIGGALGQYAPHPTTLPYLVHIVLLACVGVAVATVPSCPHLAPAVHHGLPSIDPAIRRPFLLAATESFVGWATTAIFVSLLPSFLIQSLNLHNLMVGAFVVTGLQTGMLSASFIGRGLARRAAIITAMLALGGGIWVLLVAVPYHAYALIALATLIVGFGGGVAYLAGLTIITDIAPPERRAEIISAFLVAGYLGFSIPALGVGIAANYVGLYTAIIGAAVILGVVAVGTMLSATDRNLKPVPAKT